MNLYVMSSYKGIYGIYKITKNGGQPDLVVMMTLDTRIDLVGSSISVIARRLSERGFQFERPAAMLPGPEPGAAEAIARIEREIGAVPRALTLFWLRVGSVDLCGSHPEWNGCDYPDPLVIYPPSVGDPIGES